MSEIPAPAGPVLPPWLAGIGSLLFDKAFEKAFKEPEKTLEAHYKLAAAGLGIA